MKWPRLSCCSLAANAVRFQLHALTYNLANFMRMLARPETVRRVVTTTGVCLNVNKIKPISLSGAPCPESARW